MGLRKEVDTGQMLGFWHVEFEKLLWYLSGTLSSQSSTGSLGPEEDKPIQAKETAKEGRISALSKDASYT